MGFPPCSLKKYSGNTVSPTPHPAPGARGRGMGLPTQSTQELGKAGRVSPLSSTGYLILVPKSENCGGIEG